MAQKFSDAARGVLSASITSSDTSVSIASGGSLFPVANTGASAISAAADWFKAVIQATDGIEIVYVRTHTSGSNSFANVLRGQEGTTARAFAANDVIGIRPLASDADAWTNSRVARSSSTGSAQLPSGTTAQRDGSPAVGLFRHNSDTGDFEGYSAGAWKSIGASAMIESVAEFTATAGQTTFTTSYTAGLIAVYKNGARLGSADYVATNGTTVATVVACALNDHIAVVKYVAAAIANAVAKSGDTMSGPLEVPAGATGNQVPRANEVQKYAFDSGTKTATFTAANGGVYLCDTSGGTFAVTMPSSPQAGWKVTFIDYASNFSQSNLTLSRNGKGFYGQADDYVLDQSNRGRTFIYVNDTKMWEIYV